MLEWNVILGFQVVINLLQLLQLPSDQVHVVSYELVREVQLASDVSWFHLVLEVHLCHLEHLGFMLGVPSILEKVERFLNVRIISNLSLERLFQCLHQSNVAFCYRILN